MQLSNDKLKAIRDALPGGSQIKIAVITGYNQVYVNMVLNGKVNINDNSKEIIIEAQKMIEQKMKDDQALTISIEKTISKTK